MALLILIVATVGFAVSASALAVLLLREAETERTDLARDGARCGLWSRHGA